MSIRLNGNDSMPTVYATEIEGAMGDLQPRCVVVCAPLVSSHPLAHSRPGVFYIRRTWRAGMTMTGVYRIALLPTADEQAFAKHMTNVFSKNSGAMQLTRTTSGFDHHLLKIHGD